MNLFLDIDMAAHHNLSKKTIRTSLVRVEGADWPRELLYCTRSSCGYMRRFGENAKEAQ